MPRLRAGSQPSRALARALALGFVAIWLATLAPRSLVSPDEGRYAALSLGMLQSGDWITPRLNGLLYFEKPPLQYWGGALAMALLGVNEFAARLWPGLAGIATVLLLGATARRLWGAREGRHALLIAGSTTWIVANSHFLSLDAGLGAASTLVLCSLLLAERPDAEAREKSRWMLAAWAGIALAVLSKGAIGIVIPVAALLLAGAWRLDGRVWRHLRWGPGLALLLAMAAPWFVLVSRRNPDFAWFFFVHEHFQRYTSTVHHREGAWWYFVPVLVLGFMPWTSWLPWLLRARRRDFDSSLLAAWALFVFVFFSASKSKLPSYILPMIPALVLLLARRTARASAHELRWHLLLPALLWALALVAATRIDRLVPRDTPRAALEAMACGIGGAALLFLVAAALAWVLLGRKRVCTALAVVAFAHFAATSIAMLSSDRYGQARSAAPIARALLPQIDAAAPVFAVRDYDQTLPFYLRRRIVLVDYRDEFEFGERHEPERWIPTVDAFIERWLSLPAAAAYMSPATFDGLRGRGLPMRLVFEDQRRVVVVKP